MPNSEDTNPSAYFKMWNHFRKTPLRSFLVPLGTTIFVTIVIVVMWGVFTEPLKLIEPHIFRLAIFVGLVIIASACDFSKNREEPAFICHLILNVVQWSLLAAAAIILAEYIHI